MSNYLIIVGDEFTLLNPSILFRLQISSFAQFWIKKHNKISENNFVPNKAYQTFLITNDPITFYKPILEDCQYYEWFNLSRRYLTIEDNFSRKFISSAKLDYLLEGTRLTKSVRDNIIRKKVDQNWEEILSSKNSMITSIPIKNFNGNAYPLIIERFCKTVNNSDFFIKSWEKYLGKEWSFPIELSKRPVLSNPKYT